MCSICADATSLERECSVAEAATIVKRFLAKNRKLVAPRNLAPQTVAKLSTVAKALAASEQQEVSCFKIWKLGVIANIQPCDFGAVEASVCQWLNRRILTTFTPDYQGELLAYGTFKTPRKPRIFFDEPNIPISISLRILVFGPEAGNTLSGTVNHVGGDHFGVLVHGVFNAAVPYSVAPASAPCMCASVAFTVVSLDTDNGLIINGSLVEPESAPASQPTLKRKRPASTPTSTPEGTPAQPKAKRRKVKKEPE